MFGYLKTASAACLFICLLAGGADAATLTGDQFHLSFEDPGPTATNVVIADVPASWGLPAPATLITDAVAPINAVAPCQNFFDPKAAVCPTPSQPNSSMIVHGSSAADRIENRSQRLAIFALAGSGDDTVIMGNVGGGRVDADAGVDTIIGGSGGDVINTVDTSADNIDCGISNDLVQADPFDMPATNCETIQRFSVAYRSPTNVLTYVAAPGQQNNLTFNTAFGPILTDGAGNEIVGMLGCSHIIVSTSPALPKNQVYCSGVTQLNIDPRDNADTIANNSSLPSVLWGGSGIDQVSGGSGGDQILMKDSLIDNLTDCGGGSDTIQVDLGEDASINCETITH